MRNLRPTNSLKQLILLLAAFLLTNLSIAIAEPISEADIPVRCTGWSIVYEVNADGSFVESQKWSMAAQQFRASPTVNTIWVMRGKV